MSKGIFVRIRDEKTWNEFKDFVLQKHGKLHTALGEELIEAIKTYLKNQSTHTQLSGKALKEAEALKKEILKYVRPGGSLPQNFLETMVRRVSGVYDRRSIKNRIETLLAIGFIKRDWEVDPIKGKVYRVIGDEAGKLR
ncbi:MAG: hypothetical protein J7K62_02430 [Thermoplasmata archaeon]|nr:hypothetical protein [Thermoplasmata archaeon]